MRTRQTTVFTLLALLLLTPALHAAERITQPFLGVTIREVTFDQPRPLVIRVAEIDLKNKDISFLVTPGNGDPNGDEPGDPNNETTRQTTLQFLKDQNAQLAINATFFAMGTVDTDNVGLVVSRGEQVSPFSKNWPAINIDKKNRATIVRGKDETFNVTKPRKNVTLYNAVAGSDQIVTDGKPLDDDFAYASNTNDWWLEPEELRERIA